jgi:hypothetical protein
MATSFAEDLEDMFAEPDPNENADENEEVIMDN